MQQGANTRTHGSTMRGAQRSRGRVQQKPKLLLQRGWAVARVRCGTYVRASEGETLWQDSDAGIPIQRPLSARHNIRPLSCYCCARTRTWANPALLICAVGAAKSAAGRAGRRPRGVVECPPRPASCVHLPPRCVPIEWCAMSRRVSRWATVPLSARRFWRRHGRRATHQHCTPRNAALTPL